MLINLLDLIFVALIFIIGPLLTLTLYCRMLKASIKDDKNKEAFEKEYSSLELDDTEQVRDWLENLFKK